MDRMWIKIDGIVYLNENADLCKDAHKPHVAWIPDLVSQRGDSD